MEAEIIILLAVLLVLVIVVIFSRGRCKHEQKTFYDASGDELASDQSEACFSKCQKCGKIFVIPSGFQSDAHFENYLHETEMGGSSAVKKIGKEK